MLLAVTVFIIASAVFQQGNSQYFIGLGGRCNAQAVYWYGTCRVQACVANETTLPGTSFCDIYSRFFGSPFVRCVSNLPCCVWGGTCKLSCNANENRLSVQTDCEGARIGVCCVPRPAPTGTVTLPPINITQPSVAQRQGRCGAIALVVPRVLGGQTSQPTDWPWMVRLVYGGGVRGVCSGVLVDDDTVVTVAHCLVNVPTTNIQVVLGDFDQSQLDNDEEVVSVRSVEVNRNFVPGRKGNDFALIKLSRPVRFTQTKLPACLPDPNIPIVGVDQGAECYVAGWGVADNNQVSRQLRSAPVRLMDRTTCEAVLSAVSGRFEQLPSDMICTDTALTRSDACLFDDGGMLACRDANGRFSLVGLVSQYSCGSLPTLYTRIANYTQAILARL